MVTLAHAGSVLANPCAYEAGTLLLQRTRAFQQTGPAVSPKDLLESRYYRASVDLTTTPLLGGAPLGVEEATWTDPRGVPRLLTRFPLNPGTFSAGESYDSLEALDSQIPVGVQQLSLTTSKGVVIFETPLTASPYPVPAYADGFESLQRVVPGRDLVLRLPPTPLEAGTHLLTVILVDASLPSHVVSSQTIPWTSAGANITFPGRLLEPDRSYFCTLQVQKLIPSSLSPAKTPQGQLACLAYGTLYNSLTEVPIKTLPPPPPPPRLRLQLETSPARAALEIEAVPGQRLRLETTVDFRSWTPLLETNVTENPIRHLEALVPDSGIRIFRAVYP